MTVSNNTTIAAESLAEFFKNVGKKGPNVSKKRAKSFQKVLEELWKWEQTLVLHLHLGALKRLYHHYQKLLTCTHWKRIILGQVCINYAIKMEQKTTKLSPSAPLENIDLEQRLEKQLNNVNSFGNSINNTKEMITYFKYKNPKSRKKRN